jgi:hypothetical protein
MLSKQLVEKGRASLLQIIVVIIIQRLEIIRDLQEHKARLLEATATMLLS